MFSSLFPKSFLTLRTVSSSLSTRGKIIIDSRDEAEDELLDEIEDSVEDAVEDNVEEGVEQKEGEEESSIETALAVFSGRPAVVQGWPALTSDLCAAVERPLLLPVRPWRSVIRLGSLSLINLNR
jgi:hypothetical protein